MTDQVAPQSLLPCEKSSQLQLDLKSPARESDSLPIIPTDPARRKNTLVQLKLNEMISVPLDALDIHHVFSRDIAAGTWARFQGSGDSEMYTAAALSCIASSFPPTVQKIGKRFAVVQFPETVILLWGRVDPKTEIRCSLHVDSEPPWPISDVHFLLRMVYDRPISSLRRLREHLSGEVLKVLFQDFSGTRKVAPFVARLRGVDRKTAHKYLCDRGRVSRPKAKAR